MPVSKMEQIKAADDGLNVLGRIERYAREGFGAIPADDLERLKWYGLYVHRPQGARRFMLRVRLPGGRLTLEQARGLADVSEAFARGRLDLTTRQDVQLHNVRIEDVPEVFARLGGVGLGTVHACGDTARNVVACPLSRSGAPGLAQQITRALVGKREFSNFPRKFKVAVSTCDRDCAVAPIHDVGLRAAELDGRKGFRLSVGGGLAARPHVAAPLGAFVPRAEAVEVVVAIAEIFRDEGCRERRDHARLKFLVADWGPERFRSALEARLGRPLADGPPDDDGVIAGPIDHVGVLAVGEAGCADVGLAVPAGILSADQLRALAASGAAELRVTNHQNMLLAAVPQAQVEAARRAALGAELGVDSQDWAGCVTTCTGLDFCRRAVAHTKPAAGEIARTLNEQAPDGPRVRINLTGCPNSCGRVHLAELGLSGRALRDGGERRPGFELWFGGRLGADVAFAEPSGWRLEAQRAPGVVSWLVREYQQRARGGESFTDFVERVGVEDLRRRGGAAPGV